MDGKPAADKTLDRVRTLGGSPLRILGVLGLFGLLTVLHTWPLARGLSSIVQIQPDVTAGMWSLNELALQITRDPAHLMDGNIFYPFPRTIAIVDHQFANALLAAPLAAAGAGSALLYNFMILATFFLNAVFTWLLVRRLTGSEAAALVAGCAFAFSSYHASHIVQAHLLVTQWLPLALLMLHRYFERPTWRRWVAFAGTTLLVGLSSWHIAVIGAVGIGIVALWTMASDPRDIRRRVLALAVAALLCGITLVPLARVYQQVGAMWPPRTGDGRETMGTLTRNSAALGNLVTPSLNSRAPYAATLRSATENTTGIFPGIIAMLLAVPALSLLGGVPRRAPTTWIKLLHWTLWGSSALVAVTVVSALAGEAGAPVVAVLRPAAPFVLFGVTLAAAGLIFARRTGEAEPHLAPIATYAALAIGGTLLALGPRVSLGSVDAGSGLWRLDLLPIRLIIRAPDRLSLLLMLGVAVLAGFGTSRLLRGISPGRRAVLAGAILVALNIDLAFSMTRLRPVPESGAIDEWLIEAAEDGAVIEYPLDRRQHPWALYLSQTYGRRTVNGAGYLYPWEYKEMEEENDLEPAQLLLLWEHFHPRFVVIRSNRYRSADRRRVIAAVRAQPETLLQRTRFGRDYVFELVDRGRSPGRPARPLGTSTTTATATVTPATRWTGAHSRRAGPPRTTTVTTSTLTSTRAQSKAATGSTTTATARSTTMRTATATRTPPAVAQTAMTPNLCSSPGRAGRASRAAAARTSSIRACPRVRASTTSTSTASESASRPSRSTATWTPTAAAGR